MVAECEGPVHLINPYTIIEKYYKRGSKAHKILLVHSEMVQQKALQLAERVGHLQPDIEFIEQAAMLHDIGIFLTHAPGIGCNGLHPYLLHGPLGRELLEKEDLPRHALVCDRHTGVGLSKEDIIQQELPLPHRDMLPVSIEEKIICFADLFFGKNPRKPHKEKDMDKITTTVANYGEHYLRRLQVFRDLFGV